MVKITGPLHSQAAAGSIGDSLTFSSSKGRAYARKKLDTPNPRTPPQRSMREMFKWLARQWSSLTEPEKATWIAPALADNIGQYNAFLAYNTRRWRSFAFPTKEYPAAETGNYSWRAFSYAVWIENRIRFQTYTFGLRDGWSYTFFASTDPAMIAENRTAVLIELDDTVQPRFDFWTPPSVDTWYCLAMSGTTSGKPGPLGPIRIATPP